VSSYSCSVQTISRSQGRSAPGAAAYRHGAALTDERTGERFDYTRRRGVEAQGLEGATDLAALWRAAEAAEKRSNSVVAREVRFSLPHEVSPAERARISREVAADLRHRFGTACSWANHEPGGDGDERNFHCHLLMTTRTVDAAGQLGAKTRELDAVKTTGSQAIEDIRRIVESRGNDALERAGLPRSLDRRSLAAQAEVGAIAPEAAVPTRHLGPAASALERRGVATEAGAHNRTVVQLRAVAQEAANLAAEIETTRHQVAAEIRTAEVGDLLELMPSVEDIEAAAAKVEAQVEQELAARRAAEDLARRQAERVAMAEAAVRSALRGLVFADRHRGVTRSTASEAIAAAEAATVATTVAKSGESAAVASSVRAWEHRQIGAERTQASQATKVVEAARAALAAAPNPSWWQFWRRAEREEHDRLAVELLRAERAETQAAAVLQRGQDWLSGEWGKRARGDAEGAARTNYRRDTVQPAESAARAAVMGAVAAVGHDDAARRSVAAARLAADQALHQLQALDPARAEKWIREVGRRSLPDADTERDEARIAAWHERVAQAAAARDMPEPDRDHLSPKP